MTCPVSFQRLQRLGCSLGVPSAKCFNFHDKCHKLKVFHNCQRRYSRPCLNLQEHHPHSKNLVIISGIKSVLPVISQNGNKVSHSNCRSFFNSVKYPTCNKIEVKANIPVSNENSNSRATKTISDDGLVFDRYIYVKTLDKLYEDVKNGIVLDTAYGDSRPNEEFDPSRPVILGLHDTPGTHRDLVPLLSFFAKLGCRIVCPTYPGHGDTRGIVKNFDDTFTQLTFERASFVQDFLNDLRIERVDMVVGVGASSYTALALCANMPEIYKSMALISPWPLTQARYEIQSSMFKYIQEVWEMFYLRPVARLFLPAINVATASTNEEKMTMGFLLQNLDFGEAESFALTSSLRNIPRLVAYGGKDNHVTEALYLDLLSKLDVTSDNISSNLQHAMKAVKLKQRSCLVFPESGYDLLTEQRAALCAYLLQLLQWLQPQVKI